VSVGAYFDENMSRVIAVGLHTRGIDVLTAQEDKRRRTADTLILDRATELGRILVTADEDFLAEGALRLRRGQPFGGIIYGEQARVTIRQFLDGIELICKVHSFDELQNQIFHLPL
jgi:predicted nuclease of predicted toxin-antitoxin system